MNVAEGASSLGNFIKGAFKGFSGSATELFSGSVNSAGHLAGTISGGGFKAPIFASMQKYAFGGAIAGIGITSFSRVANASIPDIGFESDNIPISMAKGAITGLGVGAGLGLLHHLNEGFKGAIKAEAGAGLASSPMRAISSTLRSPVGSSLIAGGIMAAGGYALLKSIVSTSLTKSQQQDPAQVNLPRGMAQYDDMVMGVGRIISRR